MHGPEPVRSDETSVSSDLASQLEAAGLAEVPGGTVYRVETDAGDAACEAHMTTSDGTEVTVEFDENLGAIEVQDGMGKGDPGTDHGPGAPSHDTASQDSSTA
jgi:hypothetical protein